MLSAQTNTTVVGRLRIRSNASDPQAEQQRLAQVLRLVTFHPQNLPESSLLIVRKLADPLPSRLRLRPFHVHPDSTWQQAVTAELGKLAASAARPVYMAVPANADAVLFDDRAEVLASLALDWLLGMLPNQWWWRELLRGRDATTYLMRQWIDSPQYVPGGLEILAKHSCAVQFVQRLPERVAVEMLEAVIKVYSVPRHFVKHTEIQTPLEVADQPPQQSKAADLQFSTSRRIGEHRSPWMPWVPEASIPTLSPTQKMLLVQALMLRRAPATARSSAFQESLLRWQASAASEGSTANPLAEEKQTILIDRLRQRSAQDAVVAEIDIVSLLEQPAEEGHRKPARAGNSVTDGPRMHQTTNSTDMEGITAKLRLQSEQESPIVSAGLRDDAVLDRLAQPLLSVETAYGGVFFLLNLAISLDIYGDFTSPAETGLELNIWDFLCLMASNFTGGKIESDPLWAALAELAGRTTQRPGSLFHLPKEWRVPPEWLKPFPEDYNLEPVLRNGRMVCQHPAGFLALDVPAGADKESEAVDSLQRWVGWMADYLRARLVRALGRADAVGLLCNLPARVTLTLTHVDVTFPLDHHPIEMRIAGLDRDLGWVPAAGRYIAFHFE